MALHLAELPGQRRVACPNPAEVPALARQIPAYFRHGITLAAGDTVLDVGANIGLFSLLASDWGGKPLRGFALEPAPALFAALEQNLARHATGLQAVHAAVAEQDGEMLLHYFPRLTMLSTAEPAELRSAATVAAVAEQLQLLPRPWRGLRHLPAGLRRALVRLVLAGLLRPQPLRCPQRSLSSLIDAQGIERVDLLKIDVERAEWAVLRGIRAEHWPRIRQVVMEVHDLDGRLAAVCQLLRQQGFDEPVLAQSASLKPFGVYQLWARRPAPAAA
jgi:31-O-methyltransferase